MDGYITSLSRVLVTSGYGADNLYKHSYLTYSTEGLLPVLNSHFANQQEQGMTIKGQITLPKSCLMKTFDDAFCDATNSLGYIIRLVLSMAICLGIRPTSIHQLSLSQFCDVQIENDTEIIYTELIGSNIGACKGKKEA